MAWFSGCSHQVITHRPIRVRKLGEGRYAIDGTPADCVRLGLAHFAPQADSVVAYSTETLDLLAESVQQ